MIGTFFGHRDAPAQVKPRLRAVLPDLIETVPPRFAIDHRNRWMVARSDVVVTYVVRSFGGAAKLKELAEKKKRTLSSCRSDNMAIL